MNTSEIEHIYEGFRNLSLPKEQWTHTAHLISALSLLNDRGLEKAELMMPDMIRTYNISQGGVNSVTEGYHHTITIFYLRVIDDFISEHRDLTVPVQAEKLLESDISSPYYTLEFYSKEVLFTPEARLGFVEPDIQKY